MVVTLTQMVYTNQNWVTLDKINMPTVRPAFMLQSATLSINNANILIKTTAGKKVVGKVII